MSADVAETGVSRDRFGFLHGSENGFGDGFGGKSADGADVGADGESAGRHGEDGIAVGHGVDGIDGAGHTVVGHLGDLSHLDLGEWSVRGNDANGRVSSGLTELFDAAAGTISLDDVLKAFAVHRSSARNDLA